MVRGRRRTLRRRGRRVPAIRTLNCTTAATGTQTAFARKDFQILAGCGDRAFKIVGLALQVSALSEPAIIQVHIFNQALQEIGLCNRLISQGNSWVRLRIPKSFKEFFSGETPQTQTLVRVDLLRTYQGQSVKVSFLLSCLLRFGTPEITGR